MKINIGKSFKYSIVLVCLQFITISIFAQSVAGLKPIFQRSYDQWILSDSVRLFNSETLYDYIDGAADAYLSYNFQELLVATYNGKGDSYITVEIYQHQSPIHAFGIYAQERPLRGKYSKIGAQGYQETGILNFLCNRYYVKISSHDESLATGVIINKLAMDLATKLDADAQMPISLRFLPDEGKVENSESLINTNFLGYEFLRSVLLANYKKGGKTFKVFVIPSSSANDAKSCMVKYMEVVKNPFNGNEGQFSAIDPHNGKIMLEWKGKFIWGVLNEVDAKTGSDYLKLVSDRLANTN